MGREISGRLPEAKPLEAPRVEPISKPFQYATVPAGKTKTVYELDVSGPKVAFLQYVANNYFLETYHIWEVDGKPVIDPYLELSLAPVDRPKPLLPWMRVNDFVRWRVRNKGAFDRTIEVVLDGIIVPEEDVFILISMGLPIGR